MEPAPLYLTVHVRPRTEFREQARELLGRMIEASLAEEGCESMEFVVPEDGSDDWLVFERWASRPLWEVHAASDRGARDGERLAHYLEEPLRLGFYVSA